GAGAGRAARATIPSRLYPGDADATVADERMEEADGVGTAPHTGDQHVGQAPDHLARLTACFFSDDGVEVAHHHRIGMRAERRAEEIVRRADVGYPVAQR